MLVDGTPIARSKLDVDSLGTWMPNCVFFGGKGDDGTIVGTNAGEPEGASFE